MTAVPRLGLWGRGAYIMESQLKWRRHDGFEVR
jgi:hypothetical protein